MLLCDRNDSSVLISCDNRVFCALTIFLDVAISGWVVELNVGSAEWAHIWGKDGNFLKGWTAKVRFVRELSCRKKNLKNISKSVHWFMCFVFLWLITCVSWKKFLFYLIKPMVWIQLFHRRKNFQLALLDLHLFLWNMCLIESIRMSGESWSMCPIRRTQVLGTNGLVVIVVLCILLKLNWIINCEFH